ncbi:MAG: DNRLRE domain-containing protein [Candidatus Eisenbacteria sp.]|nr:DNRLRE domain-containing protein [Candidatus Eisenbacteria bacterium]
MKIRSVGRRMARLLTILLCASFILVGQFPALPVHASTLTLQQGVGGYSGTTDTYLNDWAKTTNYGTNVNIKIRSSDVQKSLVKFDLSGEEGLLGAAINSATLSVYVTTRSNANTLTVGSYKVLREWTESQATWNIAKTSVNWGTAGCNNTTSDRRAGYSDTEVLNAVGTWFSWDVTDIVQSWISVPSSNKGIALKYVSSSGSVEYRAIMSEYGTTSIRPKLAIDYTAGAGGMGNVADGLLETSGTTLLSSGEPINLIGYGDYDLITNTELNNQAIESLFDSLEAHNINLFRLFVNGYHDHLDWGDDEIMPYQEYGSYTPRRWDLDSWDSTYFTRLEFILDEAEERGIIVQLTLFDHAIQKYYWSPGKGEGQTNGPWCHNDQSLGQFCDFPDFYTTTGSLRTYQKAFVDKIVEDTAHHWNVIYEIMNEARDGTSTEIGGWHAIVAGWIDAKAASEGHDVLISANVSKVNGPDAHHLQDVDDAVYDPEGTPDRIDIVGLHYPAWRQCNIESPPGDWCRLAGGTHPDRQDERCISVAIGRWDTYNKPIIIDDDGAFEEDDDDVVIREVNTRVEKWVAEAVAHQGHHFNHKDSLSSVDGDALDALYLKKLVLRQGVSSYAGTTDTNLWSSSPTSNYGSNIGLEISSSDSRKIIVKFDLSGESLESEVVFATLSVYAFWYANPSHALSVDSYKVLQTWTEGGATWNTYDGSNAWGTAGCNEEGVDRSGTASDTTVMNDRHTWFTWNITSMAGDWVTTPSSNKGVALKAQDQAGAFNCYSSEYVSEFRLRPTLTIWHHDPI